MLQEKEGIYQKRGRCGIWETRASTYEKGRGVNRRAEGSLNQENYLGSNHHGFEGIEKGFT